MEIYQNSSTVPVKVSGDVIGMPVQTASSGNSLKLKAESSDGRVKTMRLYHNRENLPVHTSISMFTIQGETYDGNYSVDPNFEVQTLATKKKVMRDNVTVNAIEVQRVSNLSGGTTVYIGGLFNDG